ncbi:HdeD family acid-resistance protein [Methanofollis ethanolicus]|uniref:HdeD family acid-resistance protein n=1 Tax=Methanofollis ethanolicus TaxID=488124 RepID=UPI00083416B9|nr:HdeD family acid-resistance protein [Methanofollis ethanolicus]
MNGETIRADIVVAEETIPWWLVLLQGIIALIFGLVLLAWPAQTLVVLVTFLGIYWMIMGIVALVGMFFGGEHGIWTVVFALLGIIAGIVVLAYPLYSTAIVSSFLAILIGILGIVMGAAALVQGMTGGGWAPALLGVLSMMLGIVLLANPFFTVASLVLLLGILAIIGGVSAMVFSFRLRAAG